jgi:hypothetical protein
VKNPRPIAIFRQMDIAAESIDATLAVHEGFMSEAIRQAQRALDNGEVPVGCIFVSDGKVIGEGYNRTNELKNVCLPPLLIIKAFMSFY